MKAKARLGKGRTAPLHPVIIYDNDLLECSSHAVLALSSMQVLIPCWKLREQTALYLNHRMIKIGKLTDHGTAWAGMACQAPVLDALRK